MNAVTWAAPYEPPEPPLPSAAEIIRERLAAIAARSVTIDDDRGGAS